MQTFLPPGYSFSPDKLIDSQLASQVQRMRHANIMNPFSYLSNSDWYVMIVISIFILICAVDAVESGNRKSILFIFVGCDLVLWLEMGYTHFVEPKANYNNATFKYLPKSNLKIRMLKTESEPKSVDDKKEYPYILYNRDNEKLGKMKQGRFTPYTSKSAIMFYQYYAYVNKHHLGDEFSQKVIFKIDGRYINTDGHAQWVLTNDHDLVLHLNNNLQIEQSKVVKD